MPTLFLGLTAANLLLLSIVFGLGLFATDADKPTGLYSYHISLAIAAGLMTLLAHLAVYTYFMATSRWLQAATDKANLDPNTYAGPALAGKRRVFPLAMTAIVVTMLTMFAGAGADPTLRRLWPGEVHLAAATLAVVANAFCAALEFRLIKAQGRLMDGALEVLNRTPGLIIEQG